MKYIIELNIVKDDPWIVRCNSLEEVKNYFERILSIKEKVLSFINK